MQMNGKIKITFIGSGNVATHLAQLFFEKGHHIEQIYSRNVENAEILANKVNAGFTNDLKQISPKSDIYFIAVKDDAIEYVLQEINVGGNLLVHTAGSVNIELLLNASNNIGVFYPLQTFTKNANVDFSNIPIGIEANTEKSKNVLMNLAKQVSQKVSLMNSEQRKILHLSAVFACNFTNHMAAIAEQLLAENNMDFDLLRPLLEETVMKFLNGNAIKNQTGPAKRQDESIMKQHSELLHNHPIYNEIYTLVSKSIMQLGGSD